MSKQLAVSAAFSVLMMAAYVLFGNDAASVGLAGAAPLNAIQVSAPDVVSAISDVGRILPDAR